jgi:hypothetical protein
LAIFFVVRTLIQGIDVPGYASVIVAVLLLGSIQLLTLGLFGAYLGRVFEEVKRRPLYVVSSRAGFDARDGVRESGRSTAQVPGGPPRPSLPGRHAPPAALAPAREDAGDL